MKIPYEYYGHETSLPENYQFYTKANENRFMINWRAKFTFEQGLSRYLEYLSK